MQQAIQYGHMPLPLVVEYSLAGSLDTVNVALAQAAF